ncbi:MAG: RHS repeat-associated protein, partial [Enterobacterales bacterium]
KLITTINRIPLFIGSRTLIHMNGRVYDYNLGRFLSVDPFIQEPGNSQSMNPYSYIMNNPLAGTDPSGYRSICGKGNRKGCSIIQVNQGDGKTKSGTVALDNGKKVNVTVRTNKPTDATEIGDIKLKDVESMTVGNKDDYTVYVVHQTGGTFIDKFIDSSIYHRAESTGSKFEATPVSKELRDGLLEYASSESGFQLLSNIMKNNDVVVFTDVTAVDGLETNFGGAFQGIDRYVDPFGKEQHDGEITYHRDFKSYIQNDIKLTTIRGTERATATMASDIAHEFGHTNAGLKARGLTQLGPAKNDENQAIRYFENPYRKETNKPLRTRYNRKYPKLDKPYVK